jgi:hypothetical protein
MKKTLKKMVLRRSSNLKPKGLMSLRSRKGSRQLRRNGLPKETARAITPLRDLSKRESSESSMRIILLAGPRREALMKAKLYRTHLRNPRASKLCQSRRLLLRMKAKLTVYKVHPRRSN